MPRLDCPIETCDWKSQDLGEEFAFALSTALEGHLKYAHSTTDSHAKPEKIHRPTIAKGCSTEDWGFFTSLWSSYKNG